VSFSRCKPLLGTFVEVSLSGELTEQNTFELTQNIFSKIQFIENKMSYFKRDSELNLLNTHAHINPVQVSEELYYILQFCIELNQLSKGVFDITVASNLIKKGLLPDHGFKFDASSTSEDIVLKDGYVYFEKPLIIELGGVAKGYAVDEAIKVVNNDDIHVTVNAGGDLKMSHWQNESVLIRNSNNPIHSSVKCEMQAAALATSGHYFLEGKQAITHPLHDVVLPQNQSVSVFADSCMVADALTKVACLCDDANAIFPLLGATPLNPIQ
jgi:thiamine biosynthesis lipoprotein